MGLCNAPGTFMQLMNQTFADMLDKCVLCFLDDILIFSRTEEEHLQHVRDGADAAARAGAVRQAEQVRVHAARGGVPRPPHRRGRPARGAGQGQRGAAVAAAAATSPRCARSSGLANFYRRFVKDYSRIALPLTELTKDTTAWQWGAEQQRAFDALKAALCSPPVLLVPDQSKPFVLNCDACKYAIGATLQQDHGNGLQPVAYFSAKMTRRGAQLRRARAGVHGAAARRACTGGTTCTARSRSRC